MKESGRLFMVVWCAGMAGALSFLLIDIESLIRMIPFAEGEQPPMITPLIKVASLIQHAVLIAFASATGVALARTVGLSAPVAEAIAARTPIWEAIRPQIVPGIIGGLAGGLSIVVIAYISRSYLAPEITQKSEEFIGLMPLPTRVLFGGITEEVLLRWGLLTFLVWLAWRVLQKGDGSPRPLFFVAAIILSSVLFGIGHLPIAYLLFPEADVTLTFFVVAANSVFGLISGFLYWKRGLESAIIAHMITHLVMFSAAGLASNLR
jgi:hypothetical protein